MPGNWTSYDASAASHDRLAVPSFFDQPARDLVEAADVKATDMILDIGTGSGIVAQHAARVAPQSRIIGIDPSVEMLRTARKNGLKLAAAAVMPGLPFADRAFDRVLASFVLSHVPFYEPALIDAARVLKPRGRFGATCWGSLENEHRTFWQSLAESFIDKELLANAMKGALPWEDWFADPEHLKAAFQAAGLRDIDVQRSVYTVHTNIGDFLAIREASLAARFMRHNLAPVQWERFKETAKAEFHKRFTDPIDHPRDVLIAVGTK